MAMRGGSPHHVPSAEHTQKHPTLPSTLRSEDPTGMVPTAVPMDAAASPSERKRTPRLATLGGPASAATMAPGRK
eukprot:2910914-Rhodomonas_salina.1